MKRFIDKHSEKIDGTLSCFDRVIIKGYLPFSYPKGMEDFLTINKILIKDFKHYAPKLAAIITEHAKELAADSKRPYEYLNFRGRKEEYVRNIINRDNIKEGLVCVLSALETCVSFKICYGEGRPRLEMARRKCRCIYFYYIDREFGLMYVRIQTWFPFTTQIYINGHEWLARKMNRHGITYKKVENVFIQISDYQRAQKFVDNMPNLNFPRILDTFANRVNPLMSGMLSPVKYKWIIEQAEYSTDIVFKNYSELASIYPQLLKHATLCFSAEDVMTFLGRKMSGHFEGEIRNSYKRRLPGARVKHWMKTNWLKMYNKEGRVLRIETVINNPREFKVRRWGMHKGEVVFDWFAMCKRIGNFRRYSQVGLASNQRYANALSVVDNPREAFQALDGVSRRKKIHGRSIRGFNTISVEDIKLFKAVLCGEHNINGFRNKDIRCKLFIQTSDKHKMKHQSTKVTRLFTILHAHKLIAKVPRTRRWRVTLDGHKVMSTAITLRDDVFYHTYMKTLKTILKLSKSSTQAG